mgnify:CR=1 FL=1
MSKVMLEMEFEQIAAIMISELKRQIETFRKDLERREKAEGVCIDNDPYADLDAYLNAHIEAFSLVLDYYGGDYVIK